MHNFELRNKAHSEKRERQSFADIKTGLKALGIFLMFLKPDLGFAQTKESSEQVKNPRELILKIDENMKKENIPVTEVNGKKYRIFDMRDGLLMIGYGSSGSVGSFTFTSEIPAKVKLRNANVYDLSLVSDPDGDGDVDRLLFDQRVEKIEDQGESRCRCDQWTDNKKDSTAEGISLFRGNISDFATIPSDSMGDYADRMLTDGGGILEIQIVDGTPVVYVYGKGQQKQIYAEGNEAKSFANEVNEGLYRGLRLMTGRTKK